jgi:AraC family transcriptional regulator
MSPEQLTRVLAHLQTHLETDLSVDGLARVAELSPFHFEREFTRHVGEPVKSHVTRLRLERAAFRLLINEDKVLSIALSNGFNSHETFSRAFRQRFGVSPRDYRTQNVIPREVGDAGVRRDDGLPSTGARFSISRTALCTLAPVPVAYIRHTGNYEAVSDDIFDRLTAWAHRNRLGPNFVFFGVGWDAPGVTPTARLRFDACIRVPRPFRASGEVGFQTLPSGPHALTTVVGPFSTHMDAYRQIFQQVLALKNVEPLGVPSIEQYHTDRVVVGAPTNRTDIYIPVRPRRNA